MHNHGYNPSYVASLIRPPTGSLADSDLLHGREVHGVEIYGAAYDFGPATQAKAQLLPDIAENGMKAKILLLSSDQCFSTFWILKEMFWLCGVYLNHPEQIGTIVAISPFPGHGFYGLDVLAESLDLRSSRIKGLEELLAERAAAMINTIPRQKHILVLGDSE